MAPIARFAGLAEGQNSFSAVAREKGACLKRVGRTAGQVFSQSVAILPQNLMLKSAGGSAPENW